MQRLRRVASHLAEPTPAAARPWAPPAASDPVLSADDWAFWDREGYLIVRNAAAHADVELVKREIQARIGQSLDDPGGWYQGGQRPPMILQSQGELSGRFHPRRPSANARPGSAPGR
jgi:hypothetical protein